MITDFFNWIGKICDLHDFISLLICTYILLTNKNKFKRFKQKHGNKLKWLLGGTHALGAFSILMLGSIWVVLEYLLSTPIEKLLILGFSLLTIAGIQLWMSTFYLKWKIRPHKTI